MRVYADTSWWLAYKCSNDAHHREAVRCFDSVDEIRVVWTPWQRVEVFNALRQIERAGVFETGRARQYIRLIEQEVRLGYWPHAEFDWRDATRTACELSAEHGLLMSIRGMDLFHVAIAVEVGADAFLTFDEAQRELAVAAGLHAIPEQ